MSRLNDQIEQKKLFRTEEWLLLAVLLLSFMDFYLYSLHLMVIAFVLFFLVRHSFRTTKSVLPPLMLTMALFVFCSTSFSPTVLMKRLVWPAAFLLGYNIILPVKPDPEGMARAEKKAQVCFAIAAAGFFIHLLLNVRINWGQDSTSRNTLDFWTGSSRAATGQAGLVCVPMAWCVACLFEDKKNTQKIPAVAALLAMLYYNLTLGSRTMLASLVILLVVALFYLLMHGGKKRGKIVFAIIGLCCIAALLYHYDVWGIRSLVEESILADRLDNNAGLSEDDRWRRKQEYVKLLLRYPFGGTHIRAAVGGFAHDVLLDTYDEASVFAFAAVVALLWDGIAKLLRVLRSKYLQYGTKLTILCIYISLFIVFAVEPIFAGMPWLLMAFCFFHGIVTVLVKTSATAHRASLQR